MLTSVRRTKIWYEQKPVYISHATSQRGQLVLLTMGRMEGADYPEAFYSTKMELREGSYDRMLNRIGN